MLVLDRLEGVELDAVDELDRLLLWDVISSDEELDSVDDDERVLDELDDSELLDDRELDFELLFVLDDLLDELSDELPELDRLDCEYGLLDVLELLDPVVELTVFEELVLEYSKIDDADDRLDGEDELFWLWVDELLLFDENDELLDVLDGVLDDSDVRLDVELLVKVELLRLDDSLLRLVDDWLLGLLDDELKASELELDMLVCEDSLSSVLELLCDTDERELVLERLNASLDELDDDGELLELSELETLVDELLDPDENLPELEELRLDELDGLEDRLLVLEREIDDTDDNDDGEVREDVLLLLDGVLDDGDELLFDDRSELIDDVLDRDVELVNPTED